MTFALVYDAITDNGKTLKQNNVSIPHKFELGDLVRYSTGDSTVDFDGGDGMVAFIAVLSRDCAGTPLYGITLDPGMVGANRPHSPYSGTLLEVLTKHAYFDKIEHNVASCDSFELVRKPTDYEFRQFGEYNRSILTLE